jgi:hypothetical protein
MTSVWQNYPLGIDVSHWTSNIDWDYLKQYISFAVAKCGEVQEGVSEDAWYDQGFAEKVEGAYLAGIPMGAFIFANPYAVIAKFGNGVSLDALKNLKPADNPEYTKLVEWLGGKLYYFIGIDLERWWDSYSNYYQFAQAHAITQDKVKVISSQWIMAEFKKLLEHIAYGKANKTLRDVPVVVYTSDGFVKQYCLQGTDNMFYDWAANAEASGYSLWSAWWPTMPATTTWEAVKANLPDGVTQKPYHCNFNNVLFWQFKVCTLPNGKYANTTFDVDLSLKNKDQLYQWMNFIPATPPVVVTPPVVTPPVVPPVVVTPPPTTIEERMTAAETRLDALEAWKNKPL